MAGRNVRTENLRKYRSLYENPNVRRAYEIRDKVLIFNSLSHVLGEIKEKKILEIGFGSGDILLLLARQKADCYGVETSGSAVNCLESLSPYQLHLLKRQGDRLPYDNNYFDVVVCSHVLEHLRNDKRELEEIRRVLKTNGMAVLGVPGKGVGHNFLHYREYTVRSLKRMLKNWELVYLKAYGTELFQKILALVRKVALDTTSNANIENSQSNNNKNLGNIPFNTQIYYNLIVPILLLLLFIDNLLPCSRKYPIEIWTIIRKID